MIKNEIHSADRNMTSILGFGHDCCWTKPRHL